MKAKCLHCGHTEEVNSALIVKAVKGTAKAAGTGAVLGAAALAVVTGLSLPICIALVGGAALAKYSAPLAQWLTKHYVCPQCAHKEWKIDD